MRKIFINKSDTEEKVIAAIEREPDDEITLVFPKGCKAATSDSLSAIKGTAEDLGKTFSIESVDEKLVALAESLSIDARHPFLNVEGHTLSDIVAPSSKRKTAGTGRTSKKTSASKKNGTGEEDEGDSDRSVTIPIQTEDEGKKSAPSFLDKDSREASPVGSFHHGNRLDSVDSQEETDSRRSGRGKGSRIVLIVIIIVALLGAGLWITDAFFAHATISITLKTVPWNKTDTLTGDKAATQFDTTNKTLPAEIFTQKKSITQLFPATGHTSSPQKADGTITIFNNYSTAPQQLVATTRFQTSDGKIYRLKEGVTVPGGKVFGGALLTASSIDAAVIADKSGPDYNITTPEKLSIPGFSGTPKASGFYGVVKSIVGGSIGDAKVASADDIQAAKAKTTDILKTSVSDPSLNNWPAGLIVMNGADNFQVTNMTVNTGLDADGNFSVFASASYQAVAVKETDVMGIFHQEALADLQSTFVPNFDFKNTQVAFANVKPDFNKGTLQFSATVDTTAVPSFFPADFLTSVAGQSVPSARSTMAALPGLSDGTLSVWPFWLGTLPSSESKIRLEVK